MSDVPEPVELRAPEGARVMEIDWSDGASTSYRHVVLRAFCPCAHCQGHQGPIRWAADADEADLDVDALEPVGNYAIRLVWGDGHATGIYTFRYLRELGGLFEMDLDEVKLRRFGR